MKTLATFLFAVATAAIVVAAGPACAQSAAKLVPAQSEITFTSKQMGVPVDGRFKRFDAQVQFDPKTPAAGKIGLNIDLASVSLGGPQIEDELAKPGWFDSKKAANASFQSTSIKAAGAGKFDVVGHLAIKGNVRDVTVPFTLTQAGGTTTAVGGFVLKRLDFKIGDGDWADPSMVANEVQVRFKLVLTGVPAN